MGITPIALPGRRRQTMTEPAISQSSSLAAAIRANSEEKLRLFAHQEKAFAEILATARVLYQNRWRDLPVKPRFNLLVTGGTGLGKTAMVRAVAQTLGIPIMALSTATWILVGASRRGAATTWPALVRFLLEHRLGVIFVDEVDKISGPWEWSKYLRSEIFSLLDRTVPSDLTLDDDDCPSAATRQKERLSCRIAQRRLRRGMLIVAAGAFQPFWEESGQRRIGFADNDQGPAILPDSGALAHYLPRELVNRFRAKIIHLPPLGLRDYLGMLRETAQRLPLELKEPFLERGCESARAARDNRLGVRWIEEVITETLIAVAPPECARVRSGAAPASAD